MSGRGPYLARAVGAAVTSWFRTARPPISPRTVSGRMKASRSPHDSKARGPAWLAVLTLLSACGGPGSSVSLQVDPETLDIVLGGSGTVQVTVTRSGAATGPLSLQVEGAPDWVSAAFAPTTLTGASLASTMTVSTDSLHPDAQATSLDLTVKAVGTGLSAQRTLSVNVELLDVTGIVVDEYGEPMAAVTVTASGGAPVVTAADGTFTFTDMTVPYDVTVVDITNSLGHRFEGLTTSEPRIMPASAVTSGLAGDLGADVSGTLSHASLIPVPMGHMAMVCIEGLSGIATGCDLLQPGESGYAFSANWFAPAGLNARVRAYVYATDASDKPTAVVASGAAGPAVLSNTDNEVLNIALTDTSNQASVALTATAPPGFDLASEVLISHYSDFSSIAFSSGTPDSATETLIAPFFSGAPLSVYVRADPTAPGVNSTTVGWSVGLAPGETVSMALLQPPTGISPVEGATGVTTTSDFVVANPSGGVLTFILQPGAGGTGPTFVTTTVSTTANFPDLSTFGMGLPASADYIWGVIASHDLSDVDEAVMGDGWLGGYLSLNIAAAGGGLMPEVPGRLSSSATVEVTTQ